VPAAYALHVRGGRLSRLVEEIITLPLAIPGLAIALGLLLSYGSFGGFRRSWLFILTGHVVFTMPFMVRSVMAVFSTIDIKTLDEGAASLGASPWRRFRDVIVPNAMPGILAGALMVVTLSLGEFNITWMLHTPLTKTLPIGLADAYASMRLEVASAYTLIFFVMIVPLLVAMQMFADEGQKR
jgi:putative spermidine/putrescine transport system permease protein